MNIKAIIIGLLKAHKKLVTLISSEIDTFVHTDRQTDGQLK